MHQQDTKEYKKRGCFAELTTYTDIDLELEMQRRPEYGIC